MKPQEFIDLLMPAAQRSQQETSIPASFTLAEAALESAWGQSLLTARANNLFGVKAGKSWYGDTITMRTREFTDHWLVVDAVFRKYASIFSSITDHAALLRSSPRYSAAFQHKDGEGFARAVAAAGYATDPGYADKLIAIIRDHDLARLDSA